MRRFFTLTLLSALMLTAGNSSTAQQRASAPALQETRAADSRRGAADESFARANLEASKLTHRLGTDRKFADRFVKAARSRDRAKTEALLREAGVRGEVKVEVEGWSGGEQAITITTTTTVCENGKCTTTTTTISI